ncbi:MAG: RDD family protein [Terracidiphilus sp.]|nr:RDD family protein [Terracidiphilus sp.]
MSTSASQLAPSWKQEVNRRVAAHKSHKGTSLVPPPANESQQGTSSRASEAAARVAARFAKAPSYSEVLAGEARAAVRAAEAASQAALHAQAAAESILASLEAGMEAEREAVYAVEPVRPEPPQAVQTEERPSFAIQWAPDLPKRSSEPANTHVMHGMEVSEPGIEDWREPVQDALGADSIEVVDAAQPIHANLIEFPRELVATRKVRPRLADGPYASAAEPGGQLSIFEVDPETISIEPAAAETVATAAAPVWTGAEWSGIQLDEQTAEELLEEPEVPAAAPPVQLASMSRRLLATVVDGSLIVGAFLAAAMEAASKTADLPAPRVIELGSLATLVVICALYKLLFYTLATATPGMKYARISLCTFSDKSPNCAQRCGRLGALLLSLLPVGLGVVWALFDEDHLSWHDRISRTYVRKCY